MSILPEAAKQYVGMKSEQELACDPVERGAVRLGPMLRVSRIFNAP